MGGVLIARLLQKLFESESMGKTARFQGHAPAP